jgi:hypothetical protein
VLLSYGIYRAGLPWPVDSGIAWQHGMGIYNQIFLRPGYIQADQMFGRTGLKPVSRAIFVIFPAERKSKQTMQV